MGGVNLNKKLWRIPQQGMVKGFALGLRIISMCL